MTLADAVMWLVVLCVGVPAAFRSPVAAILLAWWFVGMVAWLIFGSLPADFAIWMDAAAFVLVAVKATVLADVLVALLFIITIYAHAVLSPYDDWLASWSVGLLQFLLAGWGAIRLRSWREATAIREKINEDITRRCIALFAGRRVSNGE